MNQKEFEIFQVDAFADGIFSGNPAAVCPLERFLPDEILQNIAAENNLSETAFYCMENGSYQLRWFTPHSEVDLCGHATLAAAHIIFTCTDDISAEVNFETKSGRLSVRRIAPERYEMNFPTDKIEEIDAPYNFIKALGIQPDKAYMGKTDLLLIFKDEDKILRLSPNFELLSNLPVRGIIATAPGNTVDFVSRFFAPSVGVNEDPATGSAHTTLAVYWNQTLKRAHFRAMQLSKRRGFVECELRDDRVMLTGKAITFMKGVYFLPE